MLRGSYRHCKSLCRLIKVSSPPFPHRFDSSKTLFSSTQSRLFFSDNYTANILLGIPNLLLRNLLCPSFEFPHERLRGGSRTPPLKSTHLRSQFRKGMSERQNTKHGNEAYYGGENAGSAYQDEYNNVYGFSGYPSRELNYQTADGY